jgi:aspartate kinase
LYYHLEEAGIPGHQIVQKKADGSNISEIQFTCETRLSKTAQSILNRALKDFPGSSIFLNTDVARISIIGSGVRSNQSIENDLLQLLQGAEIPVSMLTADELTISALVPQKLKDDAVRQVHAKFCQEAIATNHTPVNI